MALLPEDTLTVLDLHRSTLLMRGQETEHTQEGSERWGGEIFPTEWCNLPTVSFRIRHVLCVYTVRVCACACMNLVYVSAFGGGFLLLFFSLGRCDEFSLERFLIKPVSGLVYASQPYTHTHTRTHTDTHTHTHTPNTCTGLRWELLLEQ